MSGRKRIFVDEGDWRRLQADAQKLATVRRDMPDLLRRVQAETDRNLARAREEIAARQAGFERALQDVSEQTRAAEERTRQKLQETSAAILAQVTASEARVQRRTGQALRAQREAFEQALENERAERTRRVNDVEAKLSALQGSQAGAAALTTTYLADTAVLRGQVDALPHERLLPGRLAELDRKVAALQADLSRTDPAFLLASARDLCHAMGELHAELTILDAEWRALRCAAESDLFQLQSLIESNATVDVTEAFDLEKAGDAPDVDHWSRGGLSRLASEVQTLLDQVRDDERPLSIEELRGMLSTQLPNLDSRIDVVVAQAITALHSSQLRANLADLIADALDRHHHYQVVEGDVGYLEGDQREAFLAKSANRVSGNAIVIEIGPATDAEGNVDDEKAPTIRLHNFDDNVSAEERHARSESIRLSVLDSAGIDLQTGEEAAEPDPRRAEVARLVAPVYKTTEREPENKKRFQTGTA